MNNKKSSDPSLRATQELSNLSNETDTSRTSARSDDSHPASDTGHRTKVGSTRVAHIGGSAYTFGEAPMDTFDLWTRLSKNLDWECDPFYHNGVKLVPHGANNDLPQVIREIMDKNNLAPGILEREIGLLYGDGPALYEPKFEGGFMVREYKDNPEIQAWLDSWPYKRFIDMAIVEFKHMKGIYVKRIRNRAGRLPAELRAQLGIDVADRINSLEVIPSTDARLVWPAEGAVKRLESVRHICVTDYESHVIGENMRIYPVYDPLNPFRYEYSVGYHNKYSFGRNFYSVPSFYGSLNWIMRSSDIPEVLRHLSENGITSIFHIHSPERYWQDKLEKIVTMYPQETDAQHMKRLDTLKDEVFEGIVKTLTGKKNAGKFIETVDFYDDQGTNQQWKVESIDQKVKDFIEAQLKISEKADSATTSGMGLHPSLSNIIVNGQLSSGSQMLYALKLYLASDTTIPEEVVMEPINQAIRANFPNSKLRMGFYHNTAQKEENVSPQDRVVNTAEAEK